jgi:hypothetical protein
MTIKKDFNDMGYKESSGKLRKKISQKEEELSNENRI